MSETTTTSEATVDLTSISLDDIVSGKASLEQLMALQTMAAQAREAKEAEARAEAHKAELAAYTEALKGIGATVKTAAEAVKSDDMQALREAMATMVEHVNAVQSGLRVQVASARGSRTSGAPRAGSCREDVVNLVSRPENAGEQWSASSIGNALADEGITRSNGQIANELRTLTENGQMTLTSESPRRWVWAGQAA